MRVRRDEERFGITVHLAMQPGGRGEVATVWGSDWPSVAERAAHWVGAQILPRSRLARRDPWTGWHGLQQPPQLGSPERRNPGHCGHQTRTDEDHRLPGRGSAHTSVRVVCHGPPEKGSYPFFRPWQHEKEYDPFRGRRSHRGFCQMAG